MTMTNAEDNSAPIPVAAPPTAGEAEILSQVADVLRALADALTPAATVRAESRREDDEPARRAGGDPAPATEDARRALENVRDTVKDIIGRAEAVTSGSVHPKIVQALAALHQALTEADQAVGLLARAAPGDDESDGAGGDYRH
jgi:hypothetical protein